MADDITWRYVDKVKLVDVNRWWRAGRREGGRWGGWEIRAIGEFGGWGGEGGRKVIEKEGRGAGVRDSSGWIRGFGLGR